MTLRPHHYGWAIAGGAVASVLGILGGRAVLQAFQPSPRITVERFMKRKEECKTLFPGKYDWIAIHKKREGKSEGNTSVENDDAATFVEWYEYGNLESSTVLLMIHGINTTGALWSFVHEYAKKKNIRIISPSLPGWGLSSFSKTDQEQNSPTVWADQVMTELLQNELQLKEIYVFGASMGGVYAAALAAALEREQVSGVMLYASLAPRTDDYDPMQDSMLSSFQTAQKSLPTLLRLLDKYVVFPLLTALVDKDGKHTFAQWEGLWYGREVISDYWRFSPADIQCNDNGNVFIVSGTEDKVACPINQELLHQMIPGSQLVRYHGDHEHALHHKEMLFEHLDLLFE